jgi:methyltransferase (TIGR00027 family)
MRAGRASETARRVAAHRLTFGRIPAPYGNPGADDALARDVASASLASAAPGPMREYLRARTRFFDGVVTGALGRGCAQVVIGAAGYDGRSLRYEKPGVLWFEVDHPATQQDKRARLDRLGIRSGHIRFVAADFTTDPVADRLRSAGLDPHLPGLFLLEGVAVYLEPSVLEALLGQLRRVAAPGSRLAISVSLSRDHDRAARARFQASVAAMGEPARSVFDADEADALLARTGWQIIGNQDASGQRLRATGLLLAAAAPPTRRPPARPGSAGHTGPAWSRPPR